MSDFLTALAKAVLAAAITTAAAAAVEALNSDA